MKKTPKRVFGALRPVKGQIAQRISVSLYPAHQEILTQREQELNVGRSTLFQLFLEIDERQSILRRELIQRLRRTANKSPTTGTQDPAHDHQELSHLVSQ